MANTVTTETLPLSSFEPYDLTPLDCVNLPIHVSAAFVFTPANIPAGAEALERGISRLIAQLPFLAGNVVLHWGSGGTVKPPSDQYLKENPMIKVQVHSKSVSVIRKPNFGFDDSVSSDSFLPIPFSLKSRKISPVIRFCINIMTDGLILCTSFNHAAMDGLGVMNVVRMIGSCCASPSTPRLPVSPDTEASVRARVSKITTNGSFMDMESYGPHHWSESRFTSCEFRFPAKRIHQLARLCNAVLHQPFLQRQSRDGVIEPANELSTSDVFSALLWFCMTRARPRAQSPSPNSYATDTTRVSVAVSVRDVLKPPIPPAYIGNAIVVASDTHACQEMVDTRATTATNSSIDKDEISLLANLASKIRHILHAADDQYVRQVVTNINSSQDRQDESYYFPDTFVTNLRLLDMRRWEFGPELGKIMNYDHLETRINGLCSVSPRCGETSGEPPWMIRVTLEPEAMGRLREDALIRWASDEKTACKL